MNRHHLRNVLRRRVTEQDFRCIYCKRTFTTDGPTRATIEHKKAKMDGGKDHVANLAAACLHCNQHRGRQMNTARMSLRLAKLAKARAAEAGNGAASARASGADGAG